MRSSCFISLIIFALQIVLQPIAFADKTAMPPATIGSLNPVKVLFIGDSLTEGYQVPKESSFPALIEAQLKTEFPGLSVINGGVSGSTTAGGMSRLKWHLRGDPKPAILVLALGANDGLRGQPVANIITNLKDVIRLAKKEGMKVLLAGMKIPPNYGAKYAADFEKSFQDLAKDEGTDLIPFLLEGVAAEPDLNLPDGIHPNAKGYEIVARTVIKHLRPILAELKP